MLSRRGHWLSPKEMKLSRGNNGYLRVSIDGTVRLVHHVVAEAFIGPRPPGALLRHLDDNKDNNHYSNLAYGSSGDNMRDCLANGNHSQATRTHCIHGHEFTPENTRVYTRTNGKTQRSCRECYRIYKRKKYKEVRGNAYNGRF